MVDVTHDRDDRCAFASIFRPRLFLFGRHQLLFEAAHLDLGAELGANLVEESTGQPPPWAQPYVVVPVQQDDGIAFTGRIDRETDVADLDAFGSRRESGVPANRGRVKRTEMASRLRTD